MERTGLLTPRGVEPDEDQHVVDGEVGEVPPLVTVAVPASLRTVGHVLTAGLLGGHVIYEGDDVRRVDRPPVADGQRVVLRRIGQGAPRLVQRVAAEGSDLPAAALERVTKLDRGFVTVVV